MTPTNVCQFQVCFGLGCRRHTNDLTGYTKEQSLKGISEWLDFWLSQKTGNSPKL